MEQTQDPTSKLEQLATDAGNEESAGSFMNPGGKKKRGRKPGSKNKAKEPDEVLPRETIDPEAEREALKPVIRPVFKLMSMAGVRAAEDERAALSDEQQEMMTHTASGVVVKYMPGVSEHADLICLSLMMSQWAITVVMLRRENLEKMRAERRAQANGHADPAAAPMMN